ENLESSRETLKTFLRALAGKVFWIEWVNFGAERKVLGVAGDNRQSVLARNGRDFCVAQIELLPPVGTIMTFELRRIASPFESRRTVELEKPCPVVLHHNV